MSTPRHREQAYYQTADWRAKRERILVRDAFVCRVAALRLQCEDAYSHACEIAIFLCLAFCRARARYNYPA